MAKFSDPVKPLHEMRRMDALRAMKGHANFAEESVHLLSSGGLNHRAKRGGAKKFDERFRRRPHKFHPDTLQRFSPVFGDGVPGFGRQADDLSR